jgi:hypothetical protein
LARRRFGIASHLVLDLATHAHDIVLWPGLASPRLGLGLYDAAPVAAFIVEFLYGILCWYVYRGGPGLLAIICIGNLANLSLLSPGIAGPEQYLAGRPLLMVTSHLLQIVVTLWCSGRIRAGRPATPTLLTALTPSRSGGLSRGRRYGGRLIDAASSNDGGSVSQRRSCRRAPSPPKSPLRDQRSKDSAWKCLATLAFGAAQPLRHE